MKKKGNVYRILTLVRHIQRLKPNEVADFVDMLNDTGVDNLCECVFNVIHTDLNLSKNKKRRLKNHILQKCSKHRIRMIANKNTPLFKRRKALKQEGRGLPLILASVIPFLTSLFTGK